MNDGIVEVVSGVVGNLLGEVEIYRGMRHRGVVVNDYGYGCKIGHFFQSICEFLLLLRLCSSGSFLVLAFAWRCGHRFGG